MGYKYGQTVKVPRRDIQWSLTPKDAGNGMVFARVTNHFSPYTVCEQSEGGSWFAHPRDFTAKELDGFGNNQID